jgi:hypothetical protein
MHKKLDTIFFNSVVILWLKKQSIKMKGGVAL